MNDRNSVLDEAAKVAESIYGDNATWLDQEVGADIAKRIRALIVTGEDDRGSTAAATVTREIADRYRYAIDWVAADSWDYCSECRDRIAWARHHDPASRLSGDEMSLLAKKYFAETGATKQAAVVATGEPTKGDEP